MNSEPTKSFNRLKKMHIFEPIGLNIRLKMYNWQLPDWPYFRYDLQSIQALISQFAEETGEVIGMLHNLSDELKQESLLKIMLSEAVKSSEIEGEYLSRKDVMSSLKKNLGLLDDPVYIKDKKASGFAQLLLSVRSSYNIKLTIPIIQDWHRMLMTGNHYIAAGSWRSGEEPMQVISGTIGKEEVHFEAPPSNKVPFEMERFVEWYNGFGINSMGTVTNALLKSSLAHLYFETIHPFEDGNGRIGRAIAEHALSSCLKRPLLISLSQSIEKDKKSYYLQLKAAQSTMEVTDWVYYFTKTSIDAQHDAKEMILLTLKKAKLFDRHNEDLNERQIKVIKKIFEQGPEGFEGGMNAKKYMTITRCSKATATRDLQQLFELNIFSKEGAGRSVRYFLSELL